MTNPELRRHADAVIQKILEAEPPQNVVLGRADVDALKIYGIPVSEMDRFACLGREIVIHGSVDNG